MRNKKNRMNRRKPVAGSRKIGALLVVLALIGLAFFLLEWIKSRKTATEHVAPAALTERHQLPARLPYTPLELQSYTSSSLPVHEQKYPRKRKPVVPGTVAIIVDDMGSSLQEAHALMAINLPLTFAVIPGLSKVRDVVKAAHERDYQVMIHMPMEPKGYPSQPLEDNGLLISQTDEEVAQRVTAYFRQVPHAVGANNHMGSRFTEDESKMRAVLQQLKAQGLFYIDSRTTPGSVGLALARSMAIDSAGRNVFLDNVKDVESIRIQLDQLASLARKNGSAIGICHPYKATIQALSVHLPKLKAEGISFVPAGDLVR